MRRCCVSKARLEPEGAQLAEVQAVELRAELGALKITALRARASAAGATEAEIDEATDESKEAMVELVAQHERLAQPHAALRVELEAKTMSTLLRRAQADGVADAALDEADEADDPRLAVIELIVLCAEGQEEQEEPAVAALRAELAQLKHGALIRRAHAAGVADAAVDEAEESDDAQGALVELIVASSSARGSASPPPTSSSSCDRRAELSQQRVRDLRAAATTAGASEDTIEACLGSDAPKAKLIELVLELETSEPQTDSDDAVAKLRAELLQLPPSQLRKRAAAEGAKVAELEAAEDGVSPKEAMIELIVSLQAVWASADSRGGEKALRAELSQLALSDLRRRAAAVGVPQGETDDALDEDDLADQVDTMINLIMTYTERTEPPHFGVPMRKEGQGKALAKSDIFRGKHVMLSYAWDSQPQVVAIKQALQAHGIPCWMDM
jgi:hypothetical protein